MVQIANIWSTKECSEDDNKRHIYCQENESEGDGGDNFKVDIDYNLENIDCEICKSKYLHYQFLHVEKWAILNDPYSISSWEKKIKRLETEEEKCLTRIDRNITTTVEALNATDFSKSKLFNPDPEIDGESTDKNYLFSSYLGSVNQKKNILLNKIDTIINDYHNERKKTKYELTLNHGDFSKQKPDRNKRVIFYFKRVHV